MEILARISSFGKRSEILLVEESVQTTISFSSLSDESSKGKSLVPSIVFSILVNFSDVDLDGGSVLGSQQSVGGRALSGNVHFNHILLFVLHL